MGTRPPPTLISFEIKRIQVPQRQVQEEMGGNCVLYELGLIGTVSLNPLKTYDSSSDDYISEFNLI